jgi:hypothetical protein
MALQMETLLNIIESTGTNPPVTLLAKYLGISKQTVYKRAKQYKIDLHTPLTRETIRKLGTALPLKGGTRKSAIDHVKDQRDEAIKQVAALQVANNIEREKAAKTWREVSDAYLKIVQTQDATISHQRREIDQLTNTLQSVLATLNVQTHDQSDIKTISGQLSRTGRIRSRSNHTTKNPSKHYQSIHHQENLQDQ